MVVVVDFNFVCVSYESLEERSSSGKVNEPTFLKREHIHQRRALYIRSTKDSGIGSRGFYFIIKVGGYPAKAMTSLLTCSKKRARATFNWKVCKKSRTTGRVKRIEKRVRFGGGGGGADDLSCGFGDSSIYQSEPFRSF